MGSIEVIVGGQFGSEGKGAITAWRAQMHLAEGRPVMAMRVAGPNAGHTVIGSCGVDTTDSVAPNLCERTDGFGWDAPEHVDDRYAWRLRAVPVAAVSNPTATLALGPGSEIDLPILLNELSALDKAGYDASRRMLVDPEATLITEANKYDEKHGRGTWELVEALGSDPSDGDSGSAGGIATSIGSTGKGIGAARADRLWRVPGLRLGDNTEALAVLRDAQVTIESVPDLALDYLDRQNTVVQIEGTQGYGLGLRAGFYPFCTSSDCRAIDFLAMAGLSPWRLQEDHLANDEEPLVVWVCLRPYPIRVGGNSGPLANETTWDELGLPTEHTTVTGKVRRVGAWDPILARRAIQANGGPGGAVKIALTMFDTVRPEVTGWAGAQDRLTKGEYDAERRNLAISHLDQYESSIGCDIAAVGTGPDTVWVP